MLGLNKYHKLGYYLRDLKNAFQQPSAGFLSMFNIHDKKRECPDQPDPPCICRPKYVKVLVTGATAGVGRICCLMLKQCRLIDELAMYDDVGTDVENAALDLSYIDTRTTVTGYEGIKRLRYGVQDANVVVLCGGFPPNAHLCDAELFSLNAPFANIMALYCANICPKAMLCIVTSPITALVPMVSEVYKRNCSYDQKRIYGVAALNAMRANTLVSLVTGECPQEVQVPLTGGQGRSLTVPCMSNVASCKGLPEGQFDCLTKLIRDADDTICNMKDNKGGAVLSAGFAAARFVINIVEGIRLRPTAVDGAFVRQKEGLEVECPYMTMSVISGLSGIEKYSSAALSDKEKQLFDDSMEELLYNIQLGESYITGEDIERKGFAAAAKKREQKQAQAQPQAQAQAEGAKDK